MFLVSGDDFCDGVAFRGREVGSLVFLVSGNDFYDISSVVVTTWGFMLFLVVV